LEREIDGRGGIRRVNDNNFALVGKTFDVDENRVTTERHVRERIMPSSSVETVCLSCVICTEASCSGKLSLYGTLPEIVPVCAWAASEK
jgi:hypothetical protein